MVSSLGRCTFSFLVRHRSGGKFWKDARLETSLVACSRLTGVHAGRVGFCVTVGGRFWAFRGKKTARTHHGSTHQRQKGSDRSKEWVLLRSLGPASLPSER